MNKKKMKDIRIKINIVKKLIHNKYLSMIVVMLVGAVMTVLVSAIAHHPPFSSLFYPKISDLRIVTVEVKYIPLNKIPKKI